MSGSEVDAFERTGGGDSSFATATLEDLKRMRLPVKRRFISLENELVTMTKEEKPDLTRIADALREFNQVFDDLRKRNNEVMMAMLTEQRPEEEQDGEYMEFSEFRDRAEKVKTGVDELTKPKPPPKTDLHSEREMRKMKLPEVQLEKYSGDLKDWLRFWGQFRSIDEDRSLTKSEKFYYLLQSLQRDTEPYQVVAAFPTSDENYEEALAALKRRFGNESLLLQVYVRELLALVISNVTSKNKIPLETLYIKVDSYIRALETLNLAKADPATWLFPLVESALPEDVLYNWQRSTDSEGKNDKTTQLQALLTFMGKEVEIKQRKDLTTTFTQNLKLGSNQDRAPPKSAKAFGDPSLKRKLPVVSMGFHNKEGRCCAFCSRTNHQTKECFKAKSMKHEERIAAMRSKGLCFVCTLPHRASDCRNKSKVKCDICGGPHVNVLCRELSSTKDAGGPPAKKSKMGETSKVVRQMSNQKDGREADDAWEA